MNREGLEKSEEKEAFLSRALLSYILSPTKFGLSPARIIEIVDKLKAIGKASWLKLLHFHIGSQVEEKKYACSVKSLGLASWSFNTAGVKR